MAPTRPVEDVGGFGAWGGAVKTVAGRFVPAPNDPMHPGKALALNHAAFRAPAMAA
jgi:hypothetical protein